MKWIRFWVTILGVSVAAGAAAQAADPEVDFNRDVKPILSENCFACHGPDKNKRKSGVRLDVKESAFGESKSGKKAIVPGDPAKSEMIVRITSTDEDEVMPPLEQHKKVTPQQLEILKKWIAAGAYYDKHWAFKKVQAPAVLPAVKDAAWPRNEIDRFILARLEREGMKPSAEEDKPRLLRRLTFDLSGLPPTLEEVDAFIKDTSPNALEKVVDRLLASPHFGERLAVPWLDLARFADTGGYHNDSLRQMWLWRDWVVKAFNDNKPFSDFTVEQLAGDLIPKATIDQKVASGFHRNVMTSDEGGIIDAEYLNLYVVDRTNTTGVTWLGMTTGCAQCHDHKYDPLTQKEYYRLYAFFNNVPENGKDGVREHNPKPFMLVPSADDQAKIAKDDADVKVLEKEVADLNKKFEPLFNRWLIEEPKAPKLPEPTGQTGHFPLDKDPDGTTADGKSINAQLTTEEAHFVPGGPAGGSFVFNTKGHLDAGNHFGYERTQPFGFSAWVRLTSAGTGHLIGKIEKEPRYRGWRIEMTERRVNVQLISAWPGNAIEVRSKEQYPENTWLHVMLSYDGSSKAAGVKLWVQGKAVKVDVKRDTLTESIASDAAPFTIGGPQNGSLSAQVDDLRIFNRTLKDDDAKFFVAAATRALLEIPEAKRTAEQKNDLKAFFRARGIGPLEEAEARIAELKKAKAEVERNIPNTMVMDELAKPRESFIKVRGAYDKNGEAVVPGVPEFLPPIGPPSNGTRLTRLDLGKWLISPDHPLTSRVAINRFWAMIFGTGLVKTLNDFGMQGEYPSHPELLEWLAADFMRDWDMKRVIKQMVVSATYRQSSRVTKEMLERDSGNRLLSHGPRNRLDAEFVRDNALAISGLLNPEMGGKGVLPAQPPGIWEVNEMGGQGYKKTAGAEQYRRGLYVYWRRSTPYPSFLTFDAPNREFCAAFRARTSTPLQSLVLMNDPVYVESARALALRAMKDGGADNKSKLSYMWRLAMAREPDAQEMSILERTLLQQHETYTKDPKAAEALIKVGDLTNPQNVPPPELATWTAVGSVILNLNETITK